MVKKTKPKVRKKRSNLYTTGRPPLFNSAKDLQTKIEDYFENGVHTRKVLIGKAGNKEIVELPIITITGLCLHLGFSSRQSFYDLEKKKEFSYTIKRARSFIELEYEEQLQIGNTIGAIFALKNFGWIDKQEVEHKGNIIINTVDTDLSKFPKPNNEEDK